MAESGSESNSEGARRKSSSSGGGKRRSTSGNATPKRASAPKSRSASRSRSTAAKRTAAAKGGRARGRQQTAQKRARQSGDAVEEFSGKSAAELRDAITRGVIRPLNLIMLTRERIEEVVEDAVERGRVTAEDAQTIVQGLLRRGREQTDTVLGDLEQLLSRSRDALGSTGGAVEAAGRARKRALDAADPVIAQADRARRAAGVGPSFPILGYDDLTAAQVQARLDGLSTVELRKVRDYERRHANRKSVLDAIAAKLT